MPELKPEPRQRLLLAPRTSPSQGAYLVSSFIECLCVYVMDFRFVIARVLCSPCCPLMATSLAPPPLAVVLVALWVFALVNIRINKIKNAARNVDSILSRRQCDMFTAAEPAIFCFILINFDFTLGLLTGREGKRERREGGSLCNRNKSQCLLNKRKMLGIK